MLKITLKLNSKYETVYRLNHKYVKIIPQTLFALEN